MFYVFFSFNALASFHRASRTLPLDQPPCHLLSIRWGKWHVMDFTHSLIPHSSSFPHLSHSPHLPLPGTLQCLGRCKGGCNACSPPTRIFLVYSTIYYLSCLSSYLGRWKRLTFVHDHPPYLPDLSSSLTIKLNPPFVSRVPWFHISSACSLLLYNLLYSNVYLTFFGTLDLFIFVGWYLIRMYISSKKLFFWVSGTTVI